MYGTNNPSRLPHVSCAVPTCVDLVMRPSRKVKLIAGYEWPYDNDGLANALFIFRSMW